MRSERDLAKGGWTRREALVRASAALALGAGVQITPFAPAHAADEKVLTVGSAFSPLSMDPALSGNGRAGVHLMPAYEPLVRTKADGMFEPALATAWEMPPDIKEATFTLRQDARFSDGEPVNAEAVKASVEYFVGKKGPFSANLATLKEIQVLDPYRVKFRLSEPQPNLISLFDACFPSADIISPKALATPDQLGTQTFGAGPYKLDSAATITGKSYSYVPNEFYYDKSRIVWDKIVISVFEDQNSGIQALKAGQLKLLVSDPFTANSNAANLGPDLRIISDPVAWTGLIIVDRDGIVQPQLKDLRVRQAINYALDRKLIVKALFGKFAEPTDQLQGRGFVGYDEADEARYPYDQAKAKALLADAGLANGFELNVGNVNNTLSTFLTQVVAAQLKKVGIQVKSVEYQNFGAMNNAARQHGFATLIFNSNSGPPNLAKFQTLGPHSSLNFYNSEDPTLTKLIADASVLPMDKADAAWKAVYARVVELAWFAPIAAIHVYYFASKSIKTPQPGQSLVIDLVNVVPAS
jgi:peptide/nickel transport system substrate-binding protein